MTARTRWELRRSCQRHGTFDDHPASVGTDTITAVYSGDSNFANSTSHVLLQSVTSASSTGATGTLAATPAAQVSYLSTASAPAVQAISSVPSLAVSPRRHRQGCQESRHFQESAPHGGSSIKFHQTQSRGRARRDRWPMVANTRKQSRRRSDECVSGPSSKPRLSFRASALGACPPMRP